MFVVIVEFVFAFCLAFNAALFVPQAIKIYKTKNADGLSPVTFSGFCIVQVFSVLHGYIKGDWIFLVGSAFALLFCGGVAFLIFKYGGGYGRK
ncbi:MAG: hypothetical protein LBF57_03170 [Holosporaceae bacterium]|jgi:MtN3 and saliva related transmembrane protein|nr:hypothetical protein [Holosporaceae bacterium]